MKLTSSARARGGNRGGTGGGGGYERTDPDHEIKRIHRIREEYDSLKGMWKETYLRGLPRLDQKALDRLLHPERADMTL